MKTLLSIVFIFVSSYMFSQKQLPDSVLQQKILGKWILIFTRGPEQFGKPTYKNNSAINITFNPNGNCTGYLFSDTEKYNDTWKIKNNTLITKESTATFYLFNDTAFGFKDMTIYGDQIYYFEKQKQVK